MDELIGIRNDKDALNTRVTHVEDQDGEWLFVEIAHDAGGSIYPSKLVNYIFWYQVPHAVHHTSRDFFSPFDDVWHRDRFATAVAMKCDVARK